MKARITLTGQKLSGRFKFKHKTNEKHRPNLIIILNSLNHPGPITIDVKHVVGLQNEPVIMLEKKNNQIIETCPHTKLLTRWLK